MTDTKRVIKGLEWILKDDKFGFGTNWTIDSKPRDSHEKAGYNITRAIEFIKEQQEIIKARETGAVWKKRT